jgi:hypothetical protein
VSERRVIVTGNDPGFYPGLWRFESSRADFVQASTETMEGL